MTDSNQFNIEFSGHVTIERMFDIHDNQNVQIINNIKNDNDPKSDFKAPEKKENLKSATIIQYTIKGRFMSR